jgi:hypothetical protein
MTKLVKKYFTNKKLSSDAESLINNYLSNKNIILAIEYLTHDGYDRHGPESNLWDLYIIEDISNNDFIIYNYHWEDWFRCKNFNEEKEYELTNYELYLQKNLCDANEYILLCIEKYINKIDNESLKNAFNLRKKELKNNYKK